jgi:hypothetical protein
MSSVALLLLFRWFSTTSLFKVEIELLKNRNATRSRARVRERPSEFGEAVCASGQRPHEGSWRGSTRVQVAVLPGLW